MLTTLLALRPVAKFVASPWARYVVAGLVAVLAVLAFQLWAERRGAKRCEDRVTIAVAQEKTRQQKEVNKVLEKLNLTEAQAFAVQQERDRLAQEIIDVAKREPIGTVCLPVSDARRLRQLQKQ